MSRHPPRTLRHKIQTSNAMQRVAESRRCSACGRRNALGRELVDYDLRVIYRRCLYCPHVKEISY